MYAFRVLATIGLFFGPGLAGLALPALAQPGTPILCERVPDGTISVDGLRGDWKELSPLELGGGYAKDRTGFVDPTAFIKSHRGKAP